MCYIREYGAGRLYITESMMNRKMEQDIFGKSLKM